MIHYILIANWPSGIICFSHYFDGVIPSQHRNSFEKDIIGKCIDQVGGSKDSEIRGPADEICLARRDGLLLTVLGADRTVNEALIKEVLHVFTDTLYNQLKCSTEKLVLQNKTIIREILTKMVSHGKIIETRPSHILSSVKTLLVD
jgi:hypothetical protein